MASSHDGTCPRDLLQGLAPSCVPTLSVSLKKILRVSRTLIITVISYPLINFPNNFNLKPLSPFIWD